MDFIVDIGYIQFYAEEAINEIDSAGDNYSLGSWFMEDGDAKTTLFTRVKNAVIKFFKNLAERISNLFGKKEVTDVLDDKDIAPNEKIELSAKNEKMIEQGNITLKELDKCKSAEDVDKAMTKYRRKKTAIKAITATAIVSVVAAIGYVHHKKNKELKQYKADQEKMLQDIEEARVKAAKERTERVKEQNAAREKEESLYAKLADKERELARLKKEKQTAAKRGHTDAVIDVTKAKIEVKRDQAEATTNIVQETVRKVQETKGIRNKASAVKSAKADLNETKHDIATSKVKQLMSRYKQMKSKGIKLKSGVDTRITVITSETASKEDKAKAWEWIEKNEPRLYYLQSRAGTTRRGAEKMKHNADMSYIKNLTQTGLNRIKNGGGRSISTSKKK